MWQPVLWINPVSVTLVVILLLTGTVGTYRAARRWPRSIRQSLFALLVAWLALTALATLSGPLGDSGTDWSLWPGLETLLTDDPDRVSGTEKAMVLRQWTANALMFVPLPLLYAAWRQMTWPRTLFLIPVGAAFSTAIELTQWLGPADRVPDLDDVCFNTIGCAVGVGIGAVAERITARLGKPVGMNPAGDRHVR